MKRFVVLVVLFALGVVALQACAKQQQAQPQAAASSAPQAAATATATAQAGATFDDLTGVAGADQIAQLAQLGVFTVQANLVEQIADPSSGPKARNEFELT